MLGDIVAPVVVLSSLVSRLSVGLRRGSGLRGTAPPQPVPSPIGTQRPPTPYRHVLYNTAAATGEQ